MTPQCVHEVPYLDLHLLIGWVRDPELLLRGSQLDGEPFEVVISIQHTLGAIQPELYTCRQATQQPATLWIPTHHTPYRLPQVSESRVYFG